MKNLALFVAALLLTISAAAYAQKEGEEGHENVPMPNTKNMPSEKRGPPKDCADACQIDLDDCLFICKQVKNPQGNAACKKACGEEAKECKESCKGDGN